MSVPSHASAACSRSEPPSRPRQPRTALPAAALEAGPIASPAARCEHLPEPLALAEATAALLRVDLIINTSCRETLLLESCKSFSYEPTLVGLVRRDGDKSQRTHGSGLKCRLLLYKMKNLV